MLRYVWDPFVRLFHWSLVAAFAVAFYTHASIWDRLLHVEAGYVAGGLILGRIAYGLLADGYASFKTFPFSPVRATRYLFSLLRGTARHYIGHNPVGAIAIYAMLTVGILAVGSGCVVYNEGWGWIDSDLSETMHHYLTWGWLLIVFVHVSGVIIESVIHHDNLIWAMITGCKRVCKVEQKPKIKSRT